jgi:YidC/Oxa1 family membrane protein insertase
MFITGYIPVFKQLIDAFDAVIQFFHDSVGLSWGFSIIALTVCVRALLVPLTLKQYHSMQALQRLAPEIKQLQEKYKDDKQRLNQEMMKFYQENKVNPFGSCLPLLLQMPVFISLFYMLRKDLKIDICGPAPQIAKVAAQMHTTITHVGCNEVVPGSAKFGFIPDLTAPATGWVLILLLVMYIGSQLGSSLLMMAPTADKNQRYMMLALPFVFVLFVRTFPAGLLVYWITTNLWTVGQQYIIKRRVATHPGPPPTDGGKPDERKTKPKPSPSDGDGDSGAKKERARTPAPAAAAVSAGGAAPPRPPRKKKKRSGRRR